MLTITKLRGAEYLLRSVADGVEDYFMGAGEAPGVWQGGWAEALGLQGVVEPEQLRALVEGRHPVSDAPLLEGHKERTVKALDLTFSAPKSVSLLWAFADPATTAEVSIAVSTASSTALGFLERQAALTRRQVEGVRRQVGTGGFAVAGFTHRTSRAGDPQLHVHCLVPNVVEREDGVHVAIDAGPIHTWLKASGTVFQAELQRQLTDRLGVAWGPERNGTRELVGFHPWQLRAFSKRTAAIETALEAGPEAVTAKERMRADDLASLKTRSRKDRNLTPEVLQGRWVDEAARAGITTGDRLARTLGHQTARDQPVHRAGLFAALVDPDIGVCATRARFTHAHVIERVAALSAARWTTPEIETMAREFLATDLVVRLASRADEAGRRRPPEYSTVEHRRIEDWVLGALEHLRTRPTTGSPDCILATALGGAPHLGEDQRAAVKALCGPGAWLRVVLAAAGHGKTALTTTAASIAATEGRTVVALAATNKAAAELRAAGLEASTIARWRLDGGRLEPGTVVVLDEVSQVSTRDAAAILEAVTTTPDTRLWCLGDVDQGRSVAPGGLAAELARLAANHQVPAAELSVNRRQQHPAERAALADYRAGRLPDSQASRTEHGWEHTAATPAQTRDDLAAAAVADIDRLSPEGVVVLAVSHVDCEDLADRIRHRLQATRRIAGPEVAGPAWGPGERRYAAGDRILLHANTRIDGERVHNGTTATVTTADPDGLQVRLEDGRRLLLPTVFVAGTRPDGTPNLSHAWARTIDGAQGGTWDQVHLLAGPNVDRQSFYVGQSRGRQPTHTWNTTHAVSDETHGNVVSDPRPPDEIVLAAATRIADRTFAARDDPHVLDRALRAERAEHETALAAGPPSLAVYHRRLTSRVERLEGETRVTWNQLGRLDTQLARVGGLHQLRPENRRAHRRLLGQHGDTAERLEVLQADLRAARAEHARIEAAVDEHRRWDAANQWRHHEIAGIDHQLDLHWTRTVLGAVAHDDPLAYGLDRLRNARSFLAEHHGPNHRDIATVDRVLTQARVARLQRIDDGHPAPEHLTATLGPLPRHAAARDAWLGLAARIEAHLDHPAAGSTAGASEVGIRLERIGSRDTTIAARDILDAAHGLADQPAPGPAGPERWNAAVEDALACRPRLEAERARSLDHGLGLGL